VHQLVNKRLLFLFFLHCPITSSLSDPSVALASWRTEEEFTFQLSFTIITLCFQQCWSFKVMTTHVHNAHHHTVCMLPVVLPFSNDNAHVPVCFWYQQQLHIWPLLTDVFLLVYHHDNLQPAGRNLTDWSRVIEQAKPLVHFFQAIFLHHFL